MECKYAKQLNDNLFHIFREMVKYFFSIYVLLRYQIATSVCKSVTNGMCGHFRNVVDTSVQKLNGSSRQTYQ